MVMGRSSMRSVQPLPGKFFLQLEIYSRLAAHTFSQCSIKPLKKGLDSVGHLWHCVCSVMTWRFVLRTTQATLASEWLLDEAGPDHPGENAEEQGTFPRVALKKTGPNE